MVVRIAIRIVESYDSTIQGVTDSDSTGPESAQAQAQAQKRAEAQLYVRSSIGKINDRESYNDRFEPFVETNTRMSPKEAFFVRKRRVSIAECIGRI
ncbi:hypothetical protein CRG98_045901 [Punica granatum]|uniref:Uncharacterized protein n=1 Tax=Punica granatum TaxID=22663 RepID=A0A2I0HPQ9_PUNGR|nr:hypothetical protein CRG98_045901 [Punica granatum]